ncbi:MAG: MBL fold metallo-hydrolase [Planctomycetota bacterium]
MSVERVERAGIAVEGISVAGIETCLHLPGFKVAVDLGCSLREVVSCPTVLFTHAHVDHLGAVVSHCATRALQHMPPPTYVVPAPVAGNVRRLLDVWRDLDGSALPCTVVPLAPGEEHELGRGLVVRAFATFHRSPSLGYAILSRRQKLRPAYQGLPEAELRRLRVEEGVEISHAIETVEAAIPGDTLIDVVEREELVRTARLLILETTFVDGRVTVAEARGEGHIHLDEVVARAELFENEEILLVHFSARYRPAEIRAALRANLPEDLAGRVTAFLAGEGP